MRLGSLAMLAAMRVGLVAHAKGTLSGGSWLPFKYEPVPAAVVAHPPVGSAKDHSLSLTFRSAAAYAPRHAQ